MEFSGNTLKREQTKGGISDIDYPDKKSILFLVIWADGPTNLWHHSMSALSSHIPFVVYFYNFA